MKTLPSNELKEFVKLLNYFSSQYPRQVIDIPVDKLTARPVRRDPLNPLTLALNEKTTILQQHVKR